VLVITYFVAITLVYDWLMSIQWALDVYYYSTKPAQKALL
jgi:hypothetical protein